MARIQRPTHPPTLTEIAEHAHVRDSATGELVGGEPLLSASRLPASVSPEAARLVADAIADATALRAELARARDDYAALATRNRQLVTERDAATASQILYPSAGAPEAVRFYCNGMHLKYPKLGCASALAIRPPPEDEATLWAVFAAARWIVVQAKSARLDDEHYCPDCAKRLAAKS